MPKLTGQSPLDKLGERLRGVSRPLLFLICIIGLVAFLGISAPLVKISSRAMAGNPVVKPAVTPAVSPSTKPADETVAFPIRLKDSTGLAYNAFFNLGLSKVNFISHYTKPMEEKGHEYTYIYWELWVTDTFDFPAAEQLINQMVVEKVPGLTLSKKQYDAKVYEVALELDGVETHRIIFSKTAVEADKDAASLAMVDVTKMVPKVEFTGRAQVAIIIDDIGFRSDIDRQFLNLPANLTFAVLPYSPDGTAFAGDATRKGHEILLHLPMEPKAYPSIKPGKGGLLLSMGPEKIREILVANLAQVPYIKGVNNHMGSAFTSDSDKMRIVLEVIKDRGLYFVDSRTAGTAKGYETAKSLGMRAGMRNVFLDHEPKPSMIARQFDLMVKVAQRQGSAIAIGHPYTATLDILRQKLPELRAKNIDVVPPSQIVK